MSKTLRVRMYNVGFGDCFLITIPSDGRTLAILVDAGYHPLGKGKFGGDDLAKQVIDDVEAEVGEKRVDVVIATHRHADHISTFNAKGWDDLDVGEVWLPWVEDKNRPGVKKLWDKQIGFARMLAKTAPSFGLDAGNRAELDFILWNAGITDDPVFQAWSNDGALKRLKKTGFGSRDRAEPRYLPEADALPHTFEVDTLPGVTVHVLGPPADPELIEHLDPEGDGETYKKLALLADEAAGASVALPFHKAWLAREELGAGGPLDDEDRERLRRLARSFDPMFAAHKLDDMINSTSLVLVLEVGKARLLLPGDAEWGTWKGILDSDDAVALLEKTTFLKVGHHGSHNATPVRLVEHVLRDGVRAMIPTQEGSKTDEKDKYRRNIPLPGLLKAMKDHGVTAVRSDKPGADLPEGFELGDGKRWIDLHLPF